MDPTASLPLHFTLETIVLSAAALLLAWAAVRRRWPAVGGALLLTVIQGLHAGQFIQGEDDPALVVSRLVAIAVLALTVAIGDPRRLLIGVGLAWIALGAIAGAIWGGGAEDLPIAAHVMLTVGAIMVLLWSWQATRPSVRLRVLAAFISVLAVAVVVAGGSVARVAAVDARNERYGTLRLEASTIVREIAQTRDVLRRRAATLSPVVAIGTDRGDPTLERSRVLAGEWVVVVDAAGKRLTEVAAENVDVPPGDVGALPVSRRALGAEVSSATSVSAEALQIIAAAPIFKPGSAQTDDDVIGAVVVGQTLTPAEMRDLTGDPIVDVALIGAVDTAGTNADLACAARGAGQPEDVGFETITCPDTESADDDGWLASFVRLPDGGAYLVVGTSDLVVVESATDLVRAFLVAILAAALLAVVAALWLSARITRPMLQLADDAEKVKSDFLASVSHELRTPLTPIRGYTEILRSRAVPARDASGYLDEIGMAAQRLERIVALLVDVAAIEAGRFNVVVEDASPEEMLTSASTRWRDRASRRIDIRVTKDLPSVAADAGAIARVLDELIDNAVKFSPEGDVELRARRTSSGIEFSVSDEGPGIDAERLKAVREAFRQEDSGDTRRFGGLGLGLTFVEGVLEAHGSKLDITSREGAGTTCLFTLASVGKVDRVSTERVREPGREPGRKKPKAKAKPKPKARR